MKQTRCCCWPTGSSVVCVASPRKFLFVRHPPKYCVVETTQKNMACFVQFCISFYVSMLFTLTYLLLPWSQMSRTCRSGKLTVMGSPSLTKSFPPKLLLQRSIWQSFHNRLLACLVKLPGVSLGKKKREIGEHCEIAAQHLLLVGVAVNLILWLLSPLSPGPGYGGVPPSTPWLNLTCPATCRVAGSASLVVIFPVRRRRSKLWKAIRTEWYHWPAGCLYCKIVDGFIRFFVVHESQTFDIYKTNCNEMLKIACWMFCSVGYCRFW